MGCWIYCPPRLVRASSAHLIKQLNITDTSRCLMHCAGRNSNVGSSCSDQNREKVERQLELPFVGCHCRLWALLWLAMGTYRILYDGFLPRMKRTEYSPRLLSGIPFGSATGNRIAIFSGKQASVTATGWHQIHSRVEVAKSSWLGSKAFMSRLPSLSIEYRDEDRSLYGPDHLLRLMIMNCFKGLFRPCSRAQPMLSVPEQIRPSSPHVPTFQEPDQSAADNPASSYKEPQSSFKEVKDTTLNALKLSLSLLSTISDSIPVPGLKGAFSGLHMVWELFDVSSLVLTTKAGITWPIYRKRTKIWRISSRSPNP